MIQIVESLVRRNIRFTAIKEAIEFDGKQDLGTKVMIALFGLFAEVERDLISERTKEGLAAAKAKGKPLGRPKRALETSRLDGKEQDIRALLGKDGSKASIAKILDVSRSAHSTHPAAAFARVHARWPRFANATARFGPQPSRRGLTTTPCEKSGLGACPRNVVALVKVDRAGGKSRSGATTVERRRLCVTDLCHQVVSDERHLDYGNRLLAVAVHEPLHLSVNALDGLR